jgi:hypothetical protein
MERKQRQTTTRRENGTWIATEQYLCDVFRSVYPIIRSCACVLDSHIYAAVCRPIKDVTLTRIDPRRIAGSREYGWVGYRRVSYATTSRESIVRFVFRTEQILTDNLPSNLRLKGTNLEGLEV